MKYVIIGNSAAAVGAVEGIRQLDQEGSVTVISDEQYHTYARPLISYFLEGKTDHQRLKLRPDDFYAKNKCRLLSGVKAVAIDHAARTVALADGNSIEYDKLCLATGSRPFVPPFKGLETVADKYTFMSLADAEQLQQAVTQESRVFIVGGGLIGLKCAEGLYNLAGSICITDLSPRLMSSVLDESCARPVQDWLESKGLRFLLGNSVEQFKGNTALMKNGETVDFDILVLAVGVRPQTELLAACGARINRGIITDEYMYTGIEGIYAAGDCTESFDISCGQSRILALMPNAVMQGECAGINMAGGNKAYTQAIPMNSMELLGMHVATAGSYSGNIYEETGSDYFRRFYCEDNLLKGYIIIGNIEGTGLYTNLIRNRLPLDSLNFELLKKTPQLSAFSTEYCSQCLERVV